MQALKNAKALILTLNRPQTLKVIEFLEKNDKTQVNAIYAALGLEQSIVSQALAHLRIHKLVTMERHGKFCLYTLDKEKINKIVQKCKELTEL